MKILTPTSWTIPNAVFFSARLIGADRESFAQRLLSRDIKKLPLDSPAICLLLAADAKVISFFWIERQSDALRLYGMKDELTRLREKLELYRFTEDASWEEGAAVSATLVETQQADENSSVGWTQLKFKFEIEMNPQTMSEGEWLQMRVQRMLPLRGWDFGDSQNIFELGLTNACDENKGCYIGQEVVERVRSRGGRPNRHLGEIQFESEIEAIEELRVETEKVGSLTKSVVRASSGYHALSWIERRFCQIGTKVRAETSNQFGVIKNLLMGPKRPPSEKS